MEKPKPIYFTREEGGLLLRFDGSGGEAHSIYFADGSQFDTVNGWRPESPRLRTIVRVPMGRAVA